MPQPALLGDAEFLIVGAGIVGCSLAFHLAEMGQRDVLVLDRGTRDEPLGSTGHAPGLLCRNSPSPVMSAMAQHTAALLATLPRDNPALSPVGSLEVTRDAGLLPELRRKLTAAEANGLTAKLVSPGEIAALAPYLDADRLAGGLHVHGDGAVEVRPALRALRDEAGARGVAFRDETEVLSLLTEGERVVGVRSPEGDFRGRQVVMAVGIWGQALAATLNLDLPLVPVQHPYLTTEPLPMLAGATAPAKRPIVRDLDRTFYMREHGDRLGFGWYNHPALACDVRGLRRANLEYPALIFDEVLDVALVPALGKAAISHRLNGVFSMTPDGGPILGPVEGRPGLWLAEAVWVTHAGGAGKALAEWLVGHEPGTDIGSFGLQRFAGRASDASRRESLRLYNTIYAWPSEVADAA